MCKFMFHKVIPYYKSTTDSKFTMSHNAIYAQR